ncbi:putative F420-dependent oxidoreductase [Crossiella equi]|uniref:F420-dependent oxidoreductase n=1 Tax=Crossiella equi TaxID=130796 RepID=A0ABS5AP80_9PSEU|nr:LLM class F420-dependent oxidoreductase [Crossiella equi]MBP2478361.1 putative F420-dependent oxidoreductase [Crossiella equi]
MSTLGVVTPFWLDRPATEALDIAVAAERTGFGTLWIGEMATFDAFGLAGAVGQRTSRIALRVGPLAAGVRSPVALALGLSTVATLSGRRVDLALGASSPEIVTGWHGVPFPGAAGRMRTTVREVRAALAGERVAAGPGRGFRLREPLADNRISVAAFGPALTRVAVEEGDEVVLNLVTAGHTAHVRVAVDTLAQEAGRAAPPLAVWLPAALDPGEATLRQLRGQLAAYLAPPGYGEMATALGHGALVALARSGAPRAELAQRIPIELLEAVCALGSAAAIARRVREYTEAGAGHVGLVPATAEDPAGRRLLTAVAAEHGLVCPR